MRFAPAVAFLWVFAGTAAAQDAECRTIESGTARLACYDRAAPPVSKARPSVSKQTKSTPATTGQGQAAQGQDFLAAENARLDAAIRNICRGC